MKAVFADTSYFVALIQPRDQYHAKAVELADVNQQMIVTTQWVLVELANFCSMPKQRIDFNLLADRLIHNAVVVPATDNWFLRGRGSFIRHLDKNWSLTDCISFAVMHEMGLTTALTADHHFEQAGFVILLK